jgi:hypothetical protein
MLDFGMCLVDKFNMLLVISLQIVHTLVEHLSDILHFLIVLLSELTVKFL